MPELSLIYQTLSVAAVVESGLSCVNKGHDYPSRLAHEAVSQCIQRSTLQTHRHSLCCVCALVVRSIRSHAQLIEGACHSLNDFALLLSRLALVLLRL